MNFIDFLIPGIRLKTSRTFANKLIMALHFKNPLVLKHVEDRFNIKIKLCNFNWKTRHGLLYVYYIYKDESYKLFSINTYSGLICTYCNVRRKDIKLLIEAVETFLNKESENKESEKKAEAIYDFSDMLQRKSSWE